MADGIRGTGDQHPKQHIQPASFTSSVGDNSAIDNEMRKAFETPVKNLAQMKKVLIDSLGEEKGKKLYNRFLTTLVESMLSQIRQTAQGADQATKSMGQNT